MLCLFSYFNKHLSSLLLLFKKDCSEKQYSRTCYEQPPLRHRKSYHTKLVAVHRRYIQWWIQMHPPPPFTVSKKATSRPKHALKCTFEALNVAEHLTRCCGVFKLVYKVGAPPPPFVNSWTRHCHSYTECYLREWSSRLALHTGGCSFYYIGLCREWYDMHMFFYVHI